MDAINNLSTGEFVNKMNEDAKKAARNKEHQGYGDPAKRLPSKDGIKN